MTPVTTITSGISQTTSAGKAGRWRPSGRPVAPAFLTGPPLGRQVGDQPVQLSAGTGGQGGAEPLVGLLQGEVAGGMGLLEQVGGPVAVGVPDPVATSTLQFAAHRSSSLYSCRCVSTDVNHSAADLAGRQGATTTPGWPASCATPPLKRAQAEEYAEQAFDRRNPIRRPCRPTQLHGHQAVRDREAALTLGVRVARRRHLVPAGQRLARAGRAPSRLPGEGGPGHGHRPAAPGGLGDSRREKRSVTELEAEEIGASLKWAIAKVERVSQRGNGERSGGPERQAERGGDFNDTPPDLLSAGRNQGAAVIGIQDAGRSVAVKLPRVAAADHTRFFANCCNVAEPPKPAQLSHLVLSSTLQPYGSLVVARWLDRR
jgi:hypothetical protein